LDPTFGSGTSLEVALALGRRAVGIEKDKTFFDKAAARLSPPAVDGNQDSGNQDSGNQEV